MTKETSEEQSLFAAPPMGEQERMVEAVLFASAAPVSVADLNARMPHGCDAAAALEHLRKRYDGPGEAVTDVFQMFVDHAIMMATPEIIGTLLIGGIVGGLVTEFLGRRFS